MHMRRAGHVFAPPLNCGVMRRDNVSSDSTPDASQSRTRAHFLLSALVAAVIGTVAGANVLFNGSQVGGSGDIPLLVLIPLFATMCSLAGVLGAAGTLGFKRWGWWLAAWYCVFSIFAAVAPFIIFWRPPVSDALQTSWLLFAAGALVYLFMPSVRASYRVSASLRRASLVVVGAGLLCTLVLFAYPAYFAVRAI
jgi:hypothetical protein